MLEILAPCGSVDVLNAALNSGADAVYLGMTSFSARRNAANFTFQELCEGIKKAHSQGVKVYVTLNTLVFDNEFSELDKAINQIGTAKADGVIVQDLGVAKRIKEAAPNLRLHASTQMTVTSASGAEFARKHGFSRVVLPRELSLEEIKAITSRVDIETEVFVHGALCVCISGQCLLSAVMGGRSGNRGLCAQPCRLDYRCGERSCALSLKDLSLIDELKQLEQAGVTSAKIEGRMKRPEYVALAVHSCKKAISGEKPDSKLLRTVFSRSGFTKAYFDGTMKDMQGVRLKEDSQGIDKALAEVRQLYKEPYKRFVLNIDVSVKQGEPVLCKADCGKFSAVIKGEAPQKAINRSTSQEEIISRMSKLGGTVFSPGEITCEADTGLSVPASLLNGLRRNAAEEISRQIAEDIEEKTE